MISPFASTASLSEATRLALARAQGHMRKAQEELASGHHADPGLTLGIRMARTISLRQEHARLDGISKTNVITSSRLEIVQSAMQGMTDNAGSLLRALVAGSSNPQGVAAAVRTAEDSLKSFVDLTNTAYDGVFLFAGDRTDVKPMEDYFSAPVPSSRQSVSDAFLSWFGFGQSDPAAAGITESAMQAFLDGPFTALFAEAAWASTWSSASGVNVSSRVSQTEIIETSANANEAPFRKMAQLFTMMADLGVENLSAPARRAVFDTATRIGGEAISSLNGVRARLGIAQERIERASERMSIQMDVFAKDIGTLENVEPSDVSVRISRSQHRSKHPMHSRLACTS